MTSTFGAGPTPRASDTHALDTVAAVRAGAARALRGHQVAEVEDATATALAHLCVAANAGAGTLPGNPAAYAAASGRNAGIDFGRSERRQARLVQQLAADTLTAPGPELPPGWQAQELRLQALDALRLARATLTQGPSKELAAAASALACLLGGEPLPEAAPDLAGQRRLARGTARLAALISAAG